LKPKKTALCKILLCLGTLGILAMPQNVMAGDFWNPNFFKDFFKKNEMMRDRVMIRNQNGEEFYFYVEMAVTPGQQEKGLMDREVLPEEEGMLFVFNSVRKRSFWMKNTLIPLDIIFLDVDGTINHIHHNAKPQDRALITSKRPAKAVLEVNGGMADRLGFKEGDVVYHPAFRNVLAPK